MTWGGNMAIETTISIKKQNYEKLCILSDNYGISKSRIISIIVTMLSNKNDSFINNRFSTAYQSIDKGNFRKMHVYLSEPVFSVSLDLRHFYRFSFSLLVAEILENHLDELILKLEGTDNYPHQIHCKIYMLDQDIKTFKHYWGIPAEKELETG